VAGDICLMIVQSVVAAVKQCWVGDCAQIVVLG
jgi:hypothetical protein